MASASTATYGRKERHLVPLLEDVPPVDLLCVSGEGRPRPAGEGGVLRQQQPPDRLRARSLWDLPRLAAAAQPLRERGEEKQLHLHLPVFPCMPALPSFPFAGIARASTSSTIFSIPAATSESRSLARKPGVMTMFRSSSTHTPAAGREKGSSRRGSPGIADSSVWAREAAPIGLRRSRTSASRDLTSGKGSRPLPGSAKPLNQFFAAP